MKRKWVNPQIEVLDIKMTMKGWKPDRPGKPGGGHGGPGEPGEPVPDLDS